MTYLEIDGILEATGTLYATYRAKLLLPREKILAGLGPAERKLVQQILDAGEPNRGWLHFHPAVIAENLKLSRDKVVTAISSLQTAGDLTLSLTGVRHAYHRKKDPGDLNILTARLVEKFQAREQADLSRLRQVLGLSAHRGCLTGYLTRHFGEVLAEPCGHCDRCLGIPAKTLKRPKSRRPTDAEIAAVKTLVDSKHAALATPRQLARFLCGMASPAATRARLTRNDAFGLFADLPFAEVLVIAEAA